MSALRFRVNADARPGAEQTTAADDKQRSVSAPAGRLLAAKSERGRLPNTSPNFRARARSRTTNSFGDTMR
jgi:hypothetical protein